jgi:cytochrome b subunit of formate dehydrogenase
MITLRLLLMVLAFVLLLLSGLGVSAPRFNLQSLGLALWVLAVLLQ